MTDENQILDRDQMPDKVKKYFDDIERINAIVSSFVEVTLPTREHFLLVMETLTRIGVASSQGNKLFQSCHILFKRDKYYIVHFKECFALDGKLTDFSAEDKARRNTIVNLLIDWKLVNLVPSDNLQTKKHPRAETDPKFRDKFIIEAPLAPLSTIKVIAYNDKSNWTLIQKYNIGKKKKVKVENAVHQT